MADSKENKEISADDFASELDDMLNEAASSMDQQALIDDDDAIDRLLMDDALESGVDEAAQIKEVEIQSEGKELTSDDDDQQIEQQQAETMENEIKDDDNSDDFNVDDLFDSVAKDYATDNDDFAEEEAANKQQLDEFAEDYDEFGEDETTVTVSDNSVPEVEQQVAENEVQAPNLDEVEDEHSSPEILEQAVEVAENLEPPEMDVIDDFSEIVENSETQATEVESDDDFLMADFDISVDDEPEEEIDEPQLDVQVIVEKSTNPETQPEPVIAAESGEEMPNMGAGMGLAALQSEIDKSNALVNTAIDEVRAQVSQLWTENETLKQQINELPIPEDKNDVIATDIESLQNELRKIKKTIKENEGKVPVITYVALGIAILALLIGGGLGAIGYGAQSEVESLSEVVSSLEEEIEILNKNDKAKEIKRLTKRVRLLTANDERLNKQITTFTQSMQSNPLQPVVEDLKKQNDHAQEAIEKLFAKVEELENRKVTPVVVKKKKKVVARTEWVVNLVSFKQEWYAKRKAADYAKKGIKANVIKVKVNGENWYRLTVKGFKSKYKAAAFAVKVKRTLNLSSVWVTKK